MGDFSIDDGDRAALKKIISDRSVKTVLEFGSGSSTAFFASLVDHVDSVEDCPLFFRKCQETFRNVSNIRMFHSMKDDGLRDLYDMAFVDGPKGARSFSRLRQTLFSLSKSYLVLLHDSKRDGEKMTLDYVTGSGFMSVRITHLETERGITLIERRYGR